MIKSKNYKTVLKHIGTWVAVTLYLLLVDPVTGTPASNILSSLIVMLNYVFVYYFIGLFVFPKYWGKNIFSVIFFTIITFALFVGFDLIIFFKVLPILGAENPYTTKKIITADFVLFLILGFASLTFYFNNLAIQKLKIQNEKETLLIMKELNFLKSQFNSHITMNFLNFCYSNVHRTLPKTAEAIELFSSILRYSLKTNPEERIILTDEVEYIDNYILLQKLLTSEVYVNFKTEGDINIKHIHPRILVTLVENVFKHGQFNDSLEPVSITLKAGRQNIEFTVTNKIKTNSKKLPSGIGLVNMKQVLELFYKDKYQLLSQSDEKHYSCSLIIND